MRIYKYTLDEAVNLVDIPGLKRVLDVQFQGDNLCIWAIVDPQVEPKTYLFTLVGTGWDFSDGALGEYVGTVQEDFLVWHVFYTDVAKVMEDEEPDYSPEGAQAYVS